MHSYKKCTRDFTICGFIYIYVGNVVPKFQLKVYEYVHMSARDILIK